MLGVLFTFMSKKKQYGLYIKFGSYPEVDIRTSVVRYVSLEFQQATSLLQDLKSFLGPP